jgi:intron-binding protein aquarius
VCYLRLKFPSPKLIGRKRKKEDGKEEDTMLDEKPCLEVEPYTIPNRGPYPFNQPKK